MKNEIRKTWVKLILSIIPTVWFSLLSIFPGWIPWLKTGDKYSIITVIVSVIMCLITIFCAILMFLDDKRKKMLISKKDIVILELSKSLREVDVFWQNVNLNYLSTGTWNHKFVLNTYVSYVMSKLIQTISMALNISESKLVATYFYHFQNENWISITSDGENKGISTETLKDNSESVFSQILKTKKMIFYPSKEIAYNEGKYIKDNRDHFQELIKNPLGSIFGTYLNISISSNTEIEFEAILAVASYGEYLCDNEQYDTISLLSEVILKGFTQKCQNAAYEILIDKFSNKS